MPQIVFLLLFVFFASSGFASEKNEFEGEIKKLIQSPSFTAKGYSLYFIDPHKKKTLLSINAKKALVPASNVKVATTIAALKLLGLRYRFHTDFLYDGEIKGGVLYGDLYIKGGGDPSIFLETMFLLSLKLQKIGIKHITGNIYGDDTFFDKNKQPLGWTKDESNEPYLAMISALSFNFNSIEVSAFPSPDGTGVTSFLEPKLPGYSLQNNVRLDAKRKAQVVIRSETKRDKTTIFLTGTMQPKGKHQFLYDTVPEPSLFFIESFRKYLKDLGITVNGKKALKKTPSKAKLLFTHKSKPLSLILRDMNKYSSNFIANQLVKTIAAETTKKPGSFSKGMEAIMNFYTREGLNAKGVKMLDGSGLSHKNRMTTEFIVNLLQYAYNDLSLYPEVANSLSIMGVDGSVEKWGVNEAAFGKIRVKTGTLTRAVSLSGITQLNNGQTVIFAMIFNDFACCVYKMRELEKKIILTLLQTRNK